MVTASVGQWDDGYKAQSLAQASCLVMGAGNSITGSSCFHSLLPPVTKQEGDVRVER